MKTIDLPDFASSICGYEGCTKRVTGLYQISDVFSYDYQRFACASCAKFWFTHRPFCKKIARVRHVATRIARTL